jgi:hypothetical protein
VPLVREQHGKGRAPRARADYPDSFSHNGPL